MAAMALFFVAGGHWGALQTVAWAGMLWQYSLEENSFATGVQKTFDGEHPCTMCVSIETAKGKERAAPVTVAAAKKIEVFPLPLTAVLPLRHSRDFVFPDPTAVTLVSRADEPPVPVPISDLV